MYYQHDGLYFKAVASSIALRLIGIPMTEITLNSEPAARPLQGEASGKPR